jgi:predicted GNAT family acetyltransferase
MDTAALSVRDNREELRYELVRGGEVLGFLLYRIEPDGAVVLVHTDVEPAYEGQGLGTVLVKGALDDLRERGVRAIPLCPFVRAYIRRHPEGTPVSAS